MRQTFRAAVLLAAIAGGGLSITQTGAAAATPVDVLLFVDDLHLMFRETPRTRDVIQRLVAEGMRPGDMWSVVTTGTSSVSQSPTTDSRLITSEVNRITGNGHGPANLLDHAARSAPDPELRHRADVAYSTAVAALEHMTPSRERSHAIVYVSNGHHPSLGDPSALIAAAQQRGVPIHVLDPRDGLVADLPPSRREAWTAYVATTRNTLLMLAGQTGGVSAFGPFELNGLLAALERARR